MLDLNKFCDSKEGDKKLLIILVMKKFVSRITDDGIHHLYLDDSSKSEFVKIAQATYFKELKDDTHVIMSDRDGVSKRIFAIEKGELYEVSIPYSCYVKFVRGVLVYQQEGIYFAIIPEGKTGKAKIVLLGEMISSSLSWLDMAAYNMPEWVYFTDNRENGTVVNYFVKGEVISVGPYEECRYINSGLLVCKKSDKLYDFYKPNSKMPVDGSKEKVFENVANQEVFIWQDIEQAWRLYENTYVFGKNAMCSTEKTKQGSVRRVLYRLTDNTVEPVALGAMEFGEGYIKVENRTYYENNGVYDFEHPKVRKGFKRLFKR